MSNKSYVEKQKRDVIALAVLVIALIIFLAITLVRAATSGNENTQSATNDANSIVSSVSNDANSDLSSRIAAVSDSEKIKPTVVTGSNFTIALDSKGKVWSWGKNDKGQLGNGTFNEDESNLKQEVKLNGSQLSNVKEVAAGEYHAAALTNDGKVYIWGYNYFGQIGSETKRVERTPQLLNLPSGTTVSHISCGADYTIMLTSDGKVMGLGDSTNGQLGYYNTLGFTSIRNAKEVLINDVTFTKIVAGYKHVLALGSDGNVYSWGDTAGTGFANVTVSTINFGEYFTTNNGEVIDIDAGYDVSMALVKFGNTGIVYTWNLGSTTATQINSVNSGTGLITPFQVRIEKYENTNTYKDSIAVVNKTYYIINEENEVYSWGVNTYGQTGAVAPSASVAASSAQKVQYQDETINKNIDKVASSSVPGVGIGGEANADTAYAVNADGYVLGWGYAGVDITDPSYLKGDSTYGNTYKLLGNGTRNFTNGKADYIGNKSLKAIVGEDIVINVGEKENLLQKLVDRKCIVGGKVNLYTDVTDGLLDGITITMANENIARFISEGADKGNVLGVKQGVTTVEVSAKNSIYLNVRVLGNEKAYAKIVSGDKYTLALKTDGTVWAWGYNPALGIIDNYHTNNNAGIIVPTQIKGLADIVDIAIGESFAMVLDDNGDVYTWGSNSVGQLGGGDTTVTSSNPTSIVDEANFSQFLTKVVLGIEGTTTDEEGNETATLDIENLPRIKAISAGKEFAMALGENNTIYTWGSDAYRQLGDNQSKLKNRYYAIAIDNILDSEGNIKTIRQIEAGSTTAYALTSEGDVYAWGYNGYPTYPCGISGAEKIAAPTKVNKISKVSKLSAGLYGEVFALTVNGSVYAWGNGYTTRYTVVGPINLINVERAVDIYALPTSAGAIIKKGDGTAEYISGTGVPTVLKTTDGSEDFTDTLLVSGGDGYFVVAKSDGTVWTSGANNYGQLGNRVGNSSVDKTQLPNLKEITKDFYALNINEVTLNVGDTESISAIYNSGFTLYPTEVNNVTMTYTSEDTTIATVSNGTITAVKQGTTYITAEDSTSGTKLRVRVNVLSNTENAFPVISVGYTHTVALKSDGSVWGWGISRYGELGYSSNTTVTDPEELSIVEGVKDVAAGAYHTLLLTNNGNVVSLGYNYYGQLGNGTKNNGINNKFDNYVKLESGERLSNIVKVKAYNYTSLALDEDGNVYAWGNNETAYATKVNTFGLKVRDITERMLLTEDGRVLQYTTSKVLNYKEGLENIVEISSASANEGSGYYLALDAEGNVYAWIKNGSDAEKVLSTDSTTVTKVTFPEGVKIVKIEAGIKSAYAIDEDGNVYSWGAGANKGTLGLGTATTKVVEPTKVNVETDEPVIEVMATSKMASNFTRTFIANKKGTVYGFGRNSSNDRLMGNSTDSDDIYWEPRLIGENFAGFVDENGNETVRVSLAKGQSITLQSRLLDAFSVRMSSATAADDSEFTWDVLDERFAKLTDLDQTNPSNKNKKTITAQQIVGETILVATETTSGKVARLYIDVVDKTGDKVAPKVESAGNHTIALKADGTVYGWGDNSSHVLGQRFGSSYSEPVEILIANRIEIAKFELKLDENDEKVVENGHEIYIATDVNGNTFECYKNGSNYYMDLNDEIIAVYDTEREYKWYKWNAEKSDYEYEKIVDKNGNTPVVVDIATSNTHTLLLTSDGRVYSCGSNYYGQLGHESDGRNYDSNGYMPKLIPDLKNIVKVVASDNVTYALDKYGNIWYIGLVRNINNFNGYHSFDTKPAKMTTVARVNVANILNKKTVDITNEYALTAEGKVIALQTGYTGTIEETTRYRAGTELSFTGLEGKIVKISKTSGDIRNSGHTAFLTSDGKVYTVGYNNKAQLGNNSTTNSFKVPKLVEKEDRSPLTGIIDVYTGNEHTIALTEDGKTYTWGNNAYKQLRTSGTEQSGGYIPFAILTSEDNRLTKTIAIGAGANHTIAVNHEGYVYDWGRGTEGQLGNQLSVDSYDAVRVGTEGVILSTNHSTLKVSESGELTASSNLLNLLTTPVADISGASSADINVASASVSSRTNDKGEQEKYVTILGRGVGTTVISVVDYEGRSNLVQVTVLPGNTETDLSVTVRAKNEAEPRTSSGKGHTLVLKSDGTVWAYGDNSYGQTTAKDENGNRITYSDKVIQVSADYFESPIIQVATGDNFSLALDSNGKVYSWGNNLYGQLGLGGKDSSVHMVPTKISSIDKRIVKIAAYGNQAMAIDADGYVYSWGKGPFGIKALDESSGVPQRLANIARAIDISLGNEHALILTAYGDVYSAGKNSLGQLGSLGVVSRVYFAKLELSDIVDISAGGNSSIAVASNGKAYVWGENTDGQLGLDSTENPRVTSPTEISIFNEKIVKASAGRDHIIVMTASGKTYIAGSNNYGQLGLSDENIAYKDEFTQITTFGNNTMNIDAGVGYTTVIKKDGTVYGFGDYNLGNEERISLTDSFTPVMITDTVSYLEEQEVTLNINGTYEIDINGKNRLNVLHKDNSSFTFESINEEIAEVDDQGIITAKAVGQTLIKVKDEDNKISVLTVKVIPENGVVAPTIDSGNKFTVVTKMDGIAYLFGNVKNVATKNVPKDINDSVSFRSVKAGDNFVVGLNVDGTVWAWGDNSKSQLGLKDIPVINQTTRLNRNYIKDIVQIGAGNKHGIALDNLGTVYVWGDNTNGQLGLDPSKDGNDIIETPKAIRPVEGKAIAVSAGGIYSSVINNEGTVYILRNGSAHAVSGITGAIKVTTEDSYTYVLTSDNKVYSVSNSTNSVVGQISAVRAEDNSIKSITTGDIKIVDIAADNGAVMLLDSNKNMYVSGSNEHGKLGIGSTAGTVSTPSYANTNVFGMGAGQNNTYYIDTEGEAYAAGINTSGELGNKTIKTVESSNKYVKIGDRTITMDPAKVSISIEETGWVLYAGDKSISTRDDLKDGNDNTDKIKKSIMDKQNSFNVFDNDFTDMNDYTFELVNKEKYRDKTVAEIKEISPEGYIKVVGKDYGVTVLKITNKETGVVKELTIYVLTEELLRMEDLYVTDSGDARFDAELDDIDLDTGVCYYLVNIEGAKNSGTLNVDLLYNDRLKAYYEETYHKDSETGEETGTTIYASNNGYDWDVSPLNLAEVPQKIRLKITDASVLADLKDYYIVVTLYKEDIVEVNDEALLPVIEYNYDYEENQKVYTKFIDPTDTQATIKLYAGDVAQNGSYSIKVFDGENEITNTSSDVTRFIGTVSVPDNANEFLVRIMDVDEIVRQYTVRILKTSIKDIHLVDMRQRNSDVIAEIDDTYEGTEYLQKYVAEIDDSNNPDQITINFRNPNIVRVEVDNVDMTNRFNGNKLTFNKQFDVDEKGNPIPTNNIVIKVTAQDGEKQYIEKYLLTVKLLSSNNLIESIKIVSIDGFYRDKNGNDIEGNNEYIKLMLGGFNPDEERYTARLADVDNPYIHEIVLHDKNFVINSEIEFEVKLENEFATYTYIGPTADKSVNHAINKLSGTTVNELNMSNPQVMETENKYADMIIRVRATNGDIQDHILRIYKESENTGLESIDVTSLPSDTTKQAKRNENGTYIGKVMRESNSYTLDIDLIDEYSEILSVIVDGEEVDVSNEESILTLVSGSEGKYKYNAKEELLGKQIKIKVKPEYGGGESITPEEYEELFVKTYILILEEMDNNANLDSIGIDYNQLPIRDDEGNDINPVVATINGKDNGILSVTSESEKATIEIFDSNPNENSNAQLIATGTRNITEKILFTNKTADLWIKVTSEDETTTTLRELKVRRNSNNVEIDKIDAVYGDPERTYNAMKDPENEDGYILVVSDKVTDPKIVVTTVDLGAVATINGQENESVLDISELESFIVNVTSEDGTESKEYIVRIVRRSVNDNFEKQIVSGATVVHSDDEFISITQPDDQFESFKIVIDDAIENAKFKAIREDETTDIQMYIVKKGQVEVPIAQAEMSDTGSIELARDEKGNILTQRIAVYTYTQSNDLNIRYVDIVAVHSLLDRLNVVGMNNTTELTPGKVANKTGNDGAIKIAANNSVIMSVDPSSNKAKVKVYSTYKPTKLIATTEVVDTDESIINVELANTTITSDSGSEFTVSMAGTDSVEVLITLQSVDGGEENQQSIRLTIKRGSTQAQLGTVTSEAIRQSELDDEGNVIEVQLTSNEERPREDFINEDNEIVKMISYYYNPSRMTGDHAYLIDDNNFRLEIEALDFGTYKVYTADEQWNIGEEVTNMNVILDHKQNYVIRVWAEYPPIGESTKETKDFKYTLRKVEKLSDLDDITVTLDMIDKTKTDPDESKNKLTVNLSEFYNNKEYDVAYNEVTGMYELDMYLPLEDGKEVKVSDLKTKGEYATAKWTDVVYENTAVTNSDYVLYDEDSDIESDYIKSYTPTMVTLNATRKIYVKVTSEHGELKTYCINLKNANELTDISLYPSDSNDNQLEAPGFEAEILDTYSDIKLNAQTHGAVTLKIEKIIDQDENVYTVIDDDSLNGVISTGDYRLYNNVLPINMLKSYTVKDINDNQVQINYADVYKIIVKAQVITQKDKLYREKLYPEVELNTTDYEYTITKASTDPNVSIVLHVDDQPTTYTVNTSTITWDEVKDENDNVVLYKATVKVPAYLPDYIQIDTMKANRRTVDITYESFGPGYELLSTDVGYLTQDLITTESLVTKQFTVETADGIIRNYEITFDKLSDDNTITGIAINGYVANSDDGIHYNSGLLSGFTSMNTEVLGAYPNAEISMHVTTIEYTDGNNNKQTANMNYNTMSYAYDSEETIDWIKNSKDNPKELMHEFARMIGYYNLHINQNQVNSIDIEVKVKPETMRDVPVGLPGDALYDEFGIEEKTYILHLDIDTALLESIDGVDIEGTMDDEVDPKEQITARDFNKTGASSYTIKKTIIVPNEVTELTLKDIKCIYNEYVVIDSNGNIIDNNTIVVSDLQVDTVKTVSFKISATNSNNETMIQEYIIDVRRASTDVGIKKLEADDRTAIDDQKGEYEYQVDVRITNDPVIKVTPNNENAKVIAATVDGVAIDADKIVDNEFTIEGIKEVLHNISDDSEPSKEVILTITIQAENKSTPTEDYTIRVIQKHTEKGLTEVEILGDGPDTQKLDYTNTLTHDVEIISSTPGIYIKGATTVCSKAQGVFVKEDDDTLTQIDPDSLLDVQDGKTRKVIIVVKDEFGDTKDYVLNVHRKSSDTTIKTLTLKLEDNEKTGRKEVVLTPDENGIYRADISVAENPTIEVATTHDKAQVADGQKTLTAGAVDMTQNVVTIVGGQSTTKSVNIIDNKAKGYKLSNLSDFYDDDTSEDEGNDEYRVVTTTFVVQAEDPAVTEEYTLVLTRKHNELRVNRNDADNEINYIYYDYVDHVDTYDTDGETVLYTTDENRNDKLSLDDENSLTMWIPANTDEITVRKIVPDCENATIEMTLDKEPVVQGDNGFVIPLPENNGAGNGAIRILRVKVTADYEYHSVEYTIRVVRKATNVGLLNIYMNGYADGNAVEKAQEVELTEEELAEQYPGYDGVYVIDVLSTDKQLDIKAISAYITSTVTIIDSNNNITDNTADIDYDRQDKKFIHPVIYNFQGFINNDPAGRVDPREVSVDILVEPEDTSHPSKKYKLIMTRLYNDNRIIELLVKGEDEEAQSDLPILVTSNKSKVTMDSTQYQANPKTNEPYEFVRQSIFTGAYSYWNWYQADVTVKSSWFTVSLNNMLPGWREMSFDISRIDGANPHTANVISTYTYDPTDLTKVIDATNPDKILEYTLTNGEYAYFKIVTRSESGLMTNESEPYVLCVHKKDEEVIVKDITVKQSSGRETSYNNGLGLVTKVVEDNGDVTYKANISIKDTYATIVIDSDNIMNCGSTQFTTTTGDGVQIKSVNKNPLGGISKQISYSINNLQKLAPKDKVIVVDVVLYPEDDTTTPTTFKIEITRQSEDVALSEIKLDYEYDENDILTPIMVNGFDVHKVITGDFSTKQQNLTSQLGYANINTITLKDENARYEIVYGDTTYTKDDLPIRVELEPEKSTATVKIVVYPEYEGNEPTTKILTLRRMSSNVEYWANDRAHTIQIDPWYSIIHYYPWGDSYTYYYSNRRYEETPNYPIHEKDANDNDIDNRFIMKVYKEIEYVNINFAKPGDNYNKIEMKLVKVVDRDGNVLSEPNTILATSNNYDSELRSAESPWTTKRLDLDIDEAREYTITFTVYPEDADMPSKDYTLTLIRLDDSTEIKEVMGNDENVPEDLDTVHAAWLKKNFNSEDRIYTMYVDDGVTEVNTQITTESYGGKIYMMDDITGEYEYLGTGTASKMVTIVNDATNPNAPFTEKKVRIVTEDGRTSEDYRFWYIRKSDDVEISKVEVDDGSGYREATKDLDGNYNIIISDSIRTVNVRMTMSFIYAEGSINDQEYKWQYVEEKNIDVFSENLKLDNGLVPINLRIHLNADQTTTGEAINNHKILFVERVSTDNTLLSVRTETENDKVDYASAVAQPKLFEGREYPTFSVLLGESRENIDLRLQTASPVATVELYDVEGNFIASKESILNAKDLPMDTDANGYVKKTIFKAVVIPKHNPQTRTYIIEVVPPEDQAELQSITVAGVQVPVVPGKYSYAIYDLLNLNTVPSGSVDAVATYNNEHPTENDEVSKVNIYTFESPNGIGEQDGEAHVAETSFVDPSYITITVTSPNKNNTNTYILWLKPVSDDKEIEEVTVNDDRVYMTIPKDLDSSYAGQFYYSFEPTVEKANVRITANSETANIRIEEEGIDTTDEDDQMTKAVAIFTEDVKDLTEDKVIDVTIIAESGNEAKYKLVLHKNTQLVGTIVTENVIDNYAGTPVVITDEDGNEITEITDELGNIKANVESGKEYTVVIKKDGYLKYTLTKFKAPYGTRCSIGTINLVAGEVIGNDEYINLRDLVQTNKKALAHTAVTPENAKYDFNGDNIIDETDLDILTKNYDKRETVVTYNRRISLSGVVYDKVYNVVPKASVRLDNITRSDVKGNYALDTVAVGDHVLTVKDSSGNIIGNINVSIVEGAESKVQRSADNKTVIITVAPNVVSMNLDITVNGTEADITVHDEKSVLVIPVINEFVADFTEDGIKMKALVTDSDISKVEFFRKTTDEDGNEIFVLVQQKNPESGDKVAVDAKYSYSTTSKMNFGDTITLKAVATDAYGNVTETILENEKCGLVKSEEEFKQFADNVKSGISYSGKVVKLGHNIDVSKLNNFTSIGSTLRSFDGIFDGCGYTIEGLTQPLFKFVAGKSVTGEDGLTKVVYAEVKNLGIVNSTITSGTGAIADKIQDAIIDNCYSTATITSTSGSPIGGIVGTVTKNSEDTANNSTIIRNCYTTGDITGGSKSNVIGGIVGEVTEFTVIENCYSTSNITTTSTKTLHIGGLVGQIRGSKAIVEYQSVPVYSKLVNSYFLQGINTYEAIGGISYEKDKLTDDEKTDIETEIAIMNNAAVVDEVTLKGLASTLGNAFKDDFDSANAINNGYPILDWQKLDNITSNTSSITPDVTITESSSKLELPLKENYTITYDYGTRVDPVTGEESEKHYGIDIATDANSTEDINVYAIADGVVTYVAAETEPGVGYGNCIEIRHEIEGKVFYSFYAHLKTLPELMVGDTVEKGDAIGIEGSTGKSTGLHLHFEIRLISQDYSSAVDPKTYLNF